MTVTFLKLFSHLFFPIFSTAHVTKCGFVTVAISSISSETSCAFTAEPDALARCTDSVNVAAVSAAEARILLQKTACQKIRHTSSQKQCDSSQHTNAEPRTPSRKDCAVWQQTLKVNQIMITLKIDPVSPESSTHGKPPAQQEARQRERTVSCVTCMLFTNKI